MEKQISELKELDENKIVAMIYDKINAYWGQFPNIWNYTTKDDIASEVTIDLYRKRKSDGVPHIIHYFNTKGDRSLKSLIGLFVYNNLVAEARSVHSTGIRNVEARRNVYSAISLETKIGSDEDGATLGDMVSDETVNISKEVDYVMLYESLPDKVVDGVFYDNGDGTYTVVSYKSLLKNILDGYNLTQIGEKLYKQNNAGVMCHIKNTGYLIKEMKQSMIDFLKDEYNYDTEKFSEGWIL